LPGLAKALLGERCFARGHDGSSFSRIISYCIDTVNRRNKPKHFGEWMLPARHARRLDRHGTSDHAAADSETIPSARPAAGEAAEIGGTGTGLALRRRRHHLRWRSVGVAATGATNGNRAAVRRLLHRLPQPQADRALAAGSDYAARVRVALGYEDLNDHDQLRSDPMLAVALNKDDVKGNNGGGSKIAAKRWPAKARSTAWS